MTARTHVFVAALAFALGAAPARAQQTGGRADERPCRRVLHAAWTGEMFIEVIHADLMRSRSR